MTAETDTQQLHTDLGDIKEMLTQMQRTLGQLAAVIGPRVQTDHPYIVQMEGVCGGRPIITGTRISVRTIAERVQLGDSPEQIVENYPPLTLAQVHDALSYYHEHRAKIDAEMVANEEALGRVQRTHQLKQRVEASTT
jgi:uncharacterized protein (DUF433 family)